MPCSPSTAVTLAASSMRLRPVGMADHADRARGHAWASSTHASSVAGVDDGAGAPRAREELDVAVGAPQRRHHDVGHDHARRGQPVGDLVEHCAVNVGIAHDATFAHSRSPCFELRLHEQHRVGVRGRAAHERRRHRAQRDERQVGDHEIDRPADLVGLEIARVGALQHGHACVGAQRPRELTAPDVDGDDAPRPCLQQAVGEAAGRGAEIEGAHSFHHDREAVERGGQLVATARHEARSLTLELDRLGGVDEARRARRRGSRRRAPSQR